jgi:hypothetical protein
VIDIDQLIEIEGLFVTEFDEDRSFYWRLLSLKEYRVMRGLRESSLLHPHSVYIEVFKRCYQGNYKALNARIPVGMYVTVGEMIMYLSGDCELDTLKEDIQISRSIYPADSVIERMKHVIFTAFPGYKIQDVDEWTRPRLLRNFVLSEHLLIMRGVGYEPMKIDEIKHPGEEDTASTRPSAAIDVSKLNFEQEADKARKELGVWGVQDAEEIERRRSSQLTTEQAAKLDKMTKPRR